MPEPVLVASAALIRDRKVLLIRRARAPYVGRWTLPGGRLEAGETAEQAVRREVREELGLEVQALAFVEDMQIAGPPPYHLTVFAGTAPDATPTADANEISALGWFAADELAELFTTPGLSGIVKAAFEITSP